jgi:hypothetical protein
MYKFFIPLGLRGAELFFLINGIIIIIEGMWYLVAYRIGFLSYYTSDFCFFMCGIYTVVGWAIIARSLRDYMKTLDLHGTKHHQVETLVENFVLREELPIRIVTGNSPAMKGLVEKILNEYNLNGEPEHYYNLGAVIVKEKRND